MCFVATAPVHRAEPRLSVARLGLADVDAALALMLHPQVRAHLFLGPASASRQALLQRAYFAAHPLGGGPLVGLLGLHAEGLSYAINPGHWGQGLGRELLTTACDVLAPAAGLRQLRAQVQRSNVRSRRLLERAGFRYAGLVAQDVAGAADVLRYDARLLASAPGAGAPIR